MLHYGMYCSVQFTTYAMEFQITAGISFICYQIKVFKLVKFSHSYKLEREVIPDLHPAVRTNFA